MIKNDNSCCFQPHAGRIEIGCSAFVALWGSGEASWEMYNKFIVPWGCVMHSLKIKYLLHELYDEWSLNVRHKSLWNVKYRDPDVQNHSCVLEDNLDMNLCRRVRQDRKLQFYLHFYSKSYRILIFSFISTNKYLVSRFGILPRTGEMERLLRQWVINDMLIGRRT